MKKPLQVACVQCGADCDAEVLRCAECEAKYQAEKPARDAAQAIEYAMTIAENHANFSGGTHGTV